MKQEQINKWIKECYENAVEKGFYECPEKHCHDGHYPYQCDEDGNVDWGMCEHCNGTGIDPDKNIGELLMQIICEIAEAVEAHRCGRFAGFKDGYSKLTLEKLIGDLKSGAIRIVVVDAYDNCIKNAFEDEIADVFIALFSICGYLGIELNSKVESFEFIDNVPAVLFEIIRYLECEHDVDHSLDSVFQLLLSFCKKFNIPIEKHIEAKMAYNKTRPYKHGKEY